MNFVGSESYWCHVYDPEEERHEELFNGYDLQCPWNEAENDELQDDKNKKPKWRDENDYEKVDALFDGAKSEVWDQARAHWHCVSCRNWACHHKTESDIKHIVDVHEAKEGNWITAVKSCFVDCHPNFL